MTVLDWLYKIVRWALGTVFIYAGGSKLLAPEIFAVLIDAYGMVPENLLMPLAVLLPVLEVVAGIGLLFEIKGSLSAISGLLVLFIAILTHGIHMELDVDCGCFGPEDPETEAFHGLRLSLFRNLVMMAGVIFIYGWRRYRAIRPSGAMVIVNQIVCKRRKEDANG